MSDRVRPMLKLEDSMPDQDPGARRRFLRCLAASIGALGVAGCDRLSKSEWFP